MGSITIGPTFPSVPSMSQEAQDFVEDQLQKARDHADSALTEAQATLSALKTPLVNINLPAVPDLPNVHTTFSALIQTGAIANVDLGTITNPNLPGFVPDAITIPALADEIPDYVPLITGLSIPDAPTPITVTLPVAPAIDTTITLPDQPTPDYGGIPDLFPLNLPEFTAPIITPFAVPAPTFAAVINEAGIDWTEPTYSGQLVTSLKATIATMLAGGTGIDPQVERLIWDRDRARLDITNLADRQKVADGFAAKGYPVPAGALLAALRGSDREARDKIAQASRDVAVKQAELEQTNRQFAVKTGLELEGLFVQMFLAVTQRSFEIAVKAVEFRIAIFNTQVQKYTTDARVWELAITQWRAQLEYAQQQIAVYKARVEAEAVKGEVNKSLVEAFRAKVQAFQAQADAYASLVKAVSVRAELEKNKVELYRAEIEGEVAKVSAKKGEFDAYTSRVQAEVAKGNLEEANSRAYSARVGAITAKAGITIQEAQARIAISNQKLQYALGTLQEFGQQSTRQLQAIQARAAVYDANTRRETAQFDANARTKQLEITATIEADKVLLGRYQAQVEQWKSQVQQIISFATLQMEALKSAGSIAATLAAGSMAGTNVSAAFNGTVNRGESTTESQSYSVSTSTGETSSNNTTTSYNHNFDGV